MKKFKKFLPLGILLALIAAVYLTGLYKFINFDAIQASKGMLKEKAAAMPLLASLLFAGLYVTTVALSLPIATLLTLLGGFLFGRVFGTFLVVSAATAGAAVLFVVAKTALGDSLRGKAGALYDKIEKGMNENAVSYLLFMRLVPLFPFFLVNIVPALFNVRLATYVWTTFVGIIPGTFVYVNAGVALGSIGNVADIASPQMLAAFAMLGLFALIPALYKKFKNRMVNARAGKLLVPLLMAVLAFASPARAAEQAQSGYGQFVKLYAGLLKQYTAPSVYDNIPYNGVDYDGWKADARYEQARNLLLATDPAQFITDAARKAFWINAYNFLTIDLILSTGERKSIRNLGGMIETPWQRYKWHIGGPEAGQDYTLDNIEHDILRKTGDPRIHFAINCASVSCPDLDDRPYTADELDGQLEGQMHAFLLNPSKGFESLDDTGTVKISKIFDWYKGDFAGGDVLSWLAQKKPGEARASSNITYLPYIWSLNSKREAR